MYYDYILNKKRAYDIGKLKRLVKADVACRKIGG